MTLGRSRILGLVLLASLGLNVLLGGLLIGDWAGDGSNQGIRGSRWFDRETARAALPAEAQKIVDAIWSRHEAAVREGYKAVREARAELQRVLTADELDPPALEAAQANLATRREAARLNITASMAELAHALPPKDRKLYFTTGAKRAQDQDARSAESAETDKPPPAQ